MLDESGFSGPRCAIERLAKPTANPNRTMMGPNYTDRARALSRSLDSIFRVPGTRFRFGLDPLLGLVPGLGDVVGGGMAAYVMWLAARAGAPAPILGRMAFNVAIDALLGAVPLLGDVVDAFWKGNLRNLGLLEQYLENPAKARSRSYVFLIFLLVLLLATIAGTIWLTYAAIRFLGGLIT
mgnify:CR=1 FL=1